MNDKPTMNAEDLEAEFEKVDEISESPDNSIRVSITGEKYIKQNVPDDTQPIEEFKIKEPIEFIKEEEATLNIDVAHIQEELILNPDGKYVSPTTNILSVPLGSVDIPPSYIERVQSNQNSNPTQRVPGVDVRQIEATGDYEVREDYSYMINPGDLGEPYIFHSRYAEWHLVTVPKGFIYDRASIPRIFWVAISKDELSNVPALLHDYFYRYGGNVPRPQMETHRTLIKKEVDYLFLTLMRKCRVKSWRSKLAYLAVDKFAGFAWQYH